MAFVMTQQEIDRRTCEVAPHALVLPAKCDICGSAQVDRVVSREISRGRMFIVGQLSPASDPSASLVFCRDCWPRWLMWRARMGFDLHEHRSDAPCSPACIARKGGRGGQFAAQMSLLWDRSEGGFFAQKSIDGQPTVNGSHLIMGYRNTRSMYRQFQRQTYYESIGDPIEVQRQLLRVLHERELAVPRARLDQILIIVEAFRSWYDAPWRERVAATFDRPQLRPELQMISAISVRYHPMSGAAGLLLVGWLASRLDWRLSPLLPRLGAFFGSARARRTEVRIALEPVSRQFVRGLAGLTLETASGRCFSLDRGPGGLQARYRNARGDDRQWTVLGASRGEPGILGGGIQRALERDPTYGPALAAALELVR